MPVNYLSRRWRQEDEFKVSLGLYEILFEIFSNKNQLHNGNCGLQSHLKERKAERTPNKHLSLSLIK